MGTGSYQNSYTLVPTFYSRQPWIGFLENKMQRPAFIRLLDKTNQNIWERSSSRVVNPILMKSTLNFAIAGNNDGPLFLLRSLKGEKTQPLFVALQKPVSPQLRAEYLRFIDHDHFFEGVDEKDLVELGDQYGIKMLFNVFCNFRFGMSLEKYEVVNVHPASLPRYRGRHPMHWALINGEKKFAVSIHKMEKEIDAGDIYWQKSIRITEGMSVKELRSALMDQLEAGFAGFLNKFMGGKIKAKPNTDDKATYVARRFPADSEIKEWTNSDLIIRKVMALRSEANPAFLKIKGQEIKLFSALPGSRRYEGIAAPFITRLAPDGFEMAFLDGKTIFFSGINPKDHNLQLNDGLAI